MVKIRLSRVGTKKRPYYRVVVADSRSKRDGRFIEVVGRYNPLGEKFCSIDGEKVLEWYKKGANPTETVKSLIKKAGIELVR